MNSAVSCKIVAFHTLVKSFHFCRYFESICKKGGLLTSVKVSAKRKEGRLLTRVQVSAKGEAQAKGKTLSQCKSICKRAVSAERKD